MTDTITAYLDQIRWDQLPIYVGLGGLSAWLGALTVLVFGEHGVPAAETAELLRLTLLLVVTFGVLLPFGTPAVGLVAQRVWGEP